MGILKLILGITMVATTVTTAPTLLDTMVTTTDHGDMDTGEGKREKLSLKLILLLTPLLILKLILGITMVDTMATTVLTMLDTMVITIAHGDMDTGEGRRGRLSPQLNQWLILMLIQRLMLIFIMAAGVMVSAMFLDTDITVWV